MNFTLIKSFLIFAFILIRILSGTTIASSSELKVVCGGVFDLCGYVDKATDQEIIPAKFEIARRFKEGMAQVRIKGRWGYIYDSGEIAIEPRFEAAGVFRNGLAEVFEDGRAGVIDSTGKFVLAPDFGRAMPLTSEIIIVVKWDRNRRKSPRNPMNLSLDLIVMNRPAGLYHLRDGWMADQNFKFKLFSKSNPKLIWAKRYAGRGLFGLMNMQGKWVVEPNFKLVQELYENRAIVVKNEPNSKSLWGAVDSNGKIVIPLKYDWLSFFENGYGFAGKNTASKPDFQHRKIGLIGINGKILGGRYFDAANKPAGAEPASVRQDGIWYYISKDGSLTRKEQDGAIIAGCPQGLQLIRAGNKLIAMGADGKPTMSVQLDYIGFARLEFSGGSLLAVQRELNCDAPIVVSFGKDKQKRWGFIRPNGQPLFDPPKFNSTYSFGRGYAAVKVGEKWGVIDTEGRFTIPLGVKKIRPASQFGIEDGWKIFQIGGIDDAQFVDGKGDTIPESMRNDLTKKVLTCKGGATVFTLDSGKHWGLKSADGEIVLPAKYRAISCYRSGVAFVTDDQKKMWCPVGLDGEKLENADCRPFYNSKRLSHHHPEPFSEDPYESSVLWMNALYRYGIGVRKTAPKWVSSGTF